MDSTPNYARSLLGDIIARLQGPPVMQGPTPARRRRRSRSHARDTQRGQSRTYVVPRAYCPKCRRGLNPEPLDSRIGTCPHCAAQVAFNFLTHAYQRARTRGARA